MEEETKIVVLGDVGSGKTSLILNIVTEKFNPTPPKFLNRIGISNEIFAPSGNHGMTYLIDYNDEKAEVILHDADAVCLCHSIADMANPEKLFESVENWLSRIRLQAHKSPPVILVGTKADLAGSHDSWAKKCQVLMTRHGEVAKAVKCSAKTNLNVLEVFVSAQKCAIYPICPMFNARAGILTTQATKAIKRIFCLVDANCDDVMDKAELSELQRLVFDCTLNDQGYEDICALLSKSNHLNVNKRGIDRDGFIALQAKLCTNLKQEVVWNMLKAFGYHLKQGDIRLRDIRLDQFDQTRFDYPDRVITFLESVFNAAKSADRETASQTDLERLFRPCEFFPDEFDLENAISPLTQNNQIDFGSFMTRWYIILVREPARAVTLVFELGYCQSVNGAAVNASRYSDEKLIEMIVQPQVNILKRRYIHLAVTGNQYVGKSSILKYVASTKKLTRTNWSGRPLRLKRSELDKQLIVEERSIDDLIKSDQRHYDAVLACYSHTDPESLSVLLGALGENAEHHIEGGCVLVQTHSDLQHTTPDSAATTLLEQFSAACCLDYRMKFAGRKTSDKSFNLTRLAEFIMRVNGHREQKSFSMSKNLQMASIGAFLLSCVLIRYLRK